MLVGQGGRQLSVGALVALPLILPVGWGFSRIFPKSDARRTGRMGGRADEDGE